MTLSECYSRLEGDYEEVLHRLRMEKLISRFAVRFLTEPSYDQLIGSMAAGNREEAFRAAHTLKGVTANMAFTKLYKSAAEITDILRAGQMDKAAEYLPTVIADYEQTINALRAYQAEL